MSEHKWELILGTGYDDTRIVRGEGDELQVKYLQEMTDYINELEQALEQEK